MRCGGILMIQCECGRWFKNKKALSAHQRYCLIYKNNKEENSPEKIIEKLKSELKIKSEDFELLEYQKEKNQKTYEKIIRDLKFELNESLTAMKVFKSQNNRLNLLLSELKDERTEADTET